VLIEHALENGRVPLSDEPVPAHFPQGVDEELDLRTELVLDGGPVNEQEAGCYPKCKGEGWPEFGKHAMLDDELAQRGNILYRTVAALTCAVRGCENRRSRCWIGG
jgi:hypothetical protein